MIFETLPQDDERPSINILSWKIKFFGAINHVQKSSLLYTKRKQAGHQTNSMGYVDTRGIAAARETELWHAQIRRQRQYLPHGHLLSASRWCLRRSLVIFDNDGTLADSLPPHVAFCRRMNEQHKSETHPRSAHLSAMLFYLQIARLLTIFVRIHGSDAG
jgi:hypothetical protein